MKQTNQASYDKIADSWQKLRGNSGVNRCIVELAKKIRRGGSVLDLGCGTGYPVAWYLSEQGLLVTGVDFSSKMIEKARSLNLKNSVFIERDITKFEPDVLFDAIVAFDSLFHVPKEKQAGIYEKMASWLKPGGYLLFTHGKKNGQTSGEMCGETFDYAALDTSEVHKILLNLGLKIELSTEDYSEESGGTRDLLIVARK